MSCVPYVHMYVCCVYVVPVPGPTFMYRRTVWYLYMVLAVHVPLVCTCNLPHTQHLFLRIRLVWFHFSMFLYIEASRALLPNFSHHPSTAQFYRLPKCRCGIRSIVPLATQISIVVSSLVIQTTTGRIIILTIVFWRWHHHCGRWWWCSW